MARLTWHGHSTFTLETDQGHRIMFDPYLDENPKSDIRVEDVDDLDYILVSHGHFDHFQDAIPWPEDRRDMLVSTFEIVSFCQSQGLENVHAMHIGGGRQFPFGYAKMTPALHGGQVDGDEKARSPPSPAAGGWTWTGSGSITPATRRCSPTCSC
jgi:L-ascorbate metabolism protein UlaG (beta-lactamase superfamily)